MLCLNKCTSPATGSPSGSPSARTLGSARCMSFQWDRHRENVHGKTRIWNGNLIWFGFTCVRGLLLFPASWLSRGDPRLTMTGVRDEQQQSMIPMQDDAASIEKWWREKRNNGSVWVHFWVRRWCDKQQQVHYSRGLSRVGLELKSCITKRRAKWTLWKSFLDNYQKMKWWTRFRISISGFHREEPQ